MTDEQQEQQEQQWLLGNTAAYRSILMECARHLGADDPLAEAASLIAERRDAIAALRGLCERMDLPNEWPDDLYLADIIEKHIERNWPDEEDDEDAPAFTINHAHLQKIMPNLPVLKLAAYFPHLVKAMEAHEINTPLRAAAFLAQIAHESGEFRWLEEIWGPTAQQKKYEPPGTLAATLGNTEKGDGYRYRGRGVIMITGRSNFKKYGALLGVDLEANPDLASKPEYAFQIAALYWKLNHCNEYADQENFKAVTRAINGGLTNLADRERYYAVARKALGVSE